MKRNSPASEQSGTNPSQQKQSSPAFSFGAHYELVVSGYRKAVLSIPAISQGEALRAKDLLASGEVGADGKSTLEQHLRHLEAQGKLEPDQPLLAFGARNNLVNYRCPAILEGRVHAVEGEEPARSRRPYYGIGYRDGRLACDTVTGGASMAEGWDFFCAGIPVLWEGWEDERLLDLLLCETADHSHLFDLPRGKHPAATDATRNAWQTLQTAFIEHLHDDHATAAAALRQTLQGFAPPLRRCADYFHAIMGIRDDGALVCLFAQGRLEDLGQLMRRRGCRRAVCLENSGSVMPTYLPDGNTGTSIPLIRAPNSRPKGRAIIALTLENAGFSSQPVML